jgi:hypothetical protein
MPESTANVRKIDCLQSVILYLEGKWVRIFLKKNRNEVEHVGLMAVGFGTNTENLITQGNISGPIVHDARIAAICFHHGVGELWTADRDGREIVTDKLPSRTAISRVTI